jgi:hypothetical protein
MMNNCANPRCAKPLHYLREGRVFVFDMSGNAEVGNGEKRSHRLEHYWLCGECSQKFMVERNTTLEPGITLVPRRHPASSKVEHMPSTALAS